MKWQEFTNQTVRDELRDAIGKHQEILRTHLSESATLARKYLLLVNAGAAAALIAFMGNSARVRDSHVAWVCLGCFAFGVALVGVLTALDYQIKVTQFRTWVRQSTGFFRNLIDLDVLLTSLEPVEKKYGFAPAIAGYLAFLCFLVGGAVALVHFLYPSASRQIDAYEVYGHAPVCSLIESIHVMSCDYYSQQHCESDPQNKPPSDGMCVARPD